MRKVVRYEVGEVVCGATVVAEVPEVRAGGYRVYTLRCPCGKEFSVPTFHMYQAKRLGRLLSCGCIKHHACRKPYSNNLSTGIRGVYGTPNGGYKTILTVNKKMIYLGYSMNLEEAIQMRRDAELRYLPDVDDWKKGGADA